MTMGMDENCEKDDTNVLRAGDVVPPYNTNAHQGWDLQEMGDEERTKRAKNIPDRSDVAVQGESKIPKFDLAEQIMAEQRKITSIRRKAPGQKVKTPYQKPKTQPIGYTIKQPPILSEQEKIITEIVARDIQKLYRSDSSSLLR